MNTMERKKKRYRIMSLPRMRLQGSILKGLKKYRVPSLPIEVKKSKAPKKTTQESLKRMMSTMKRTKKANRQ